MDVTIAVPTHARYHRKRRSEAALAAADLRQSLSLSWFWMALGWNDIRHRYRGSMLGPFWLTITAAIFIAGLGPLYARLFSFDLAGYLPFMALGVTIWQFITGAITDSCSAFIASAHLMKQVRLPRLVLLFRVIWRNIIAFLHNAPIYVVIFVAFGLPLDWHLLAIVPGFILVCLNLTWMGLAVAILCARFRDAAPIIAAALQIGFFVTPVMWNYKVQHVDPLIVMLNPFAAIIELMRAPLMGEAIAPALLLSAVICLVVGSAFAAVLFIRFRRQIVYWV
jgi:ABC-type polysaccharide/polyol phosphate export permease